MRTARRPSSSRFSKGRRPCCPSPTSRIIMGWTQRTRGWMRPSARETPWRRPERQPRSSSTSTYTWPKRTLRCTRCSSGVSVSPRRRARSGTMSGMVPRERFPEAIGWIFPLLGPVDRQNLVQVFQMLMPPEVFSGVKGLIRGRGRRGRLGGAVASLVRVMLRRRHTRHADRPAADGFAEPHSTIPIAGAKIGSC